MRKLNFVLLLFIKFIVMNFNTWKKFHQDRRGMSINEVSLYEFFLRFCKFFFVLLFVSAGTHFRFKYGLINGGKFKCWFYRHFVSFSVFSVFYVRKNIEIKKGKRLATNRWTVTRADIVPLSRMDIRSVFILIVKSWNSCNFD